MEDAARNRDDAHDQQRPSKVVSKGRCDRAVKVLPQAVRYCRLIQTNTTRFGFCRNFATEPMRGTLTVEARRNAPLMAERGLGSTNSLKPPSFRGTGEKRGRRFSHPLTDS